MIFGYGGSFQGSSHVKRGNVCQDASYVKKLNNGIAIAAIADGVGSCEYSDIASGIAVRTAVRICADGLQSNPKADMTELIRDAFSQAELEIDKYSLSRDHLITEYDTTLSLVIYDGRQVTYGHCGDGGIIGLTRDGDYIAITTPQKTDGQYVIPLRAGKDTWIIKKASGNYASILLATDGVYDTFFPYLLKGQPVEVYVPLVRFFMDNRLLKVSRKTIETIQKTRVDYLDSEACASITDDKTLIVLVNADVKPKIKADTYYAEPDWDALQLEWNKKAYPHLYDEEAKESATEKSEEEPTEEQAEKPTEEPEVGSEGKSIKEPEGKAIEESGEEPEEELKKESIEESDEKPIKESIEESTESLNEPGPPEDNTEKPLIPPVDGTVESL